MVVGDLVDLHVTTRGERGGRTGDTRVVGVDRQFQPCVIHGLDQQRQILTPVAGHDGVRTRLLDFGDVGREVFDLRDRVQVLAHNGSIRALGGHALLEVLGDLLAVRVILVDQVDLFDVGLVFHEGRQGFHFHGRVSVQAEMAKSAFFVGEGGIDRRVVEVNHFFPRVALVVLLHRIGQHQRDGRAVALRHVAKALVNGGFQDVLRFLRRALVVHAHHFKIDTSGVFGAAQTLGDELPALELVLPHIREGTRQAFNHCDFYGLARHRASRLGSGSLRKPGDGQTGQQHANRSATDYQFHKSSPIKLRKPRPQRASADPRRVQVMCQAEIRECPSCYHPGD